jgi:hypothetical protein
MRTVIGLALAGVASGEFRKANDKSSRRAILFACY